MSNPVRRRRTSPAGGTDGVSPAGTSPYLAMPEADLEEHVRVLCEDLGLYRYHPHDSRRSPSGFPDDVIVGTRILYRELKTETGTVTAEQERVGWAITGAGGDWDCWRPSDLLSGRIARELRAISPLGNRFPPGAGNPAWDLAAAARAARVP